MLQYNQPITFGRNGLARQCEPHGFSFEEDGAFSWTVDQLAHLELRLPIPRSDVVLEVQARPFIHETEIPYQQVYFYLNGLFQGFATFRSERTATFHLLRSAFSPRGNRLSFVLPTAKSPEQAGLSSDVRVLGLALSAVTFVAQ